MRNCVRYIAAALIALWPLQSFAASTTFTGKDASGATLTFDATSDASSHLAAWQVICDAAALAHCAAVTTGGALTVDGSGVTQPITGSISNTGFTALQGGSANAVGNPFFVSPGTGATWAATQSGTWNITNISGTVSLPTGAATLANQTSQITQETATASALGTTADAPCTLPATTTACSQIAVSKATANAANSPPPLGTSGGITPLKLNGLTNTATAIKASGGQLFMLQCGNTNASEAYVQIYNVASGSVTVGTTAPTLSIPVAATATGGFALSLVGLQFGTAISAAATTTATGGTAPGTALDCNAGFN